MQPQFNIQRERNNRLCAYRYRNDKCLFQFHSQIEIYFVDEGEMEMSVRGQHRTLKAGEISVALSYDTHAYKTPVASRSSVLLIPPHLCEEFMAITKGKRSASPFISDPEVYRRLKECHQAIRENVENRLVQRGYVYLALGILVEAVAFEDAEDPINADLASQILFYIAENYKNDITPASVATHFGYSQSYLARYFKACFGITLGNYIVVVKLRNALTLMREVKNDITYCAMESGFSSMRTFYRAFHNEFGCSPKEYLEREQL